MKHKWKVFLVLGIEFVAILLLLMVIFFAGKKTYTVTFELNGGTLLSGEVVQRVTQGQSANPPTVTKDGCYFLDWSGSYRQVTKDITVKAIWEYETTEGIIYSKDVEGEDSTYCEIIGCYPEISGDVYIGAYHNGKKVLGIREDAFKNCENITSVHLLDGILAIEDGAFEGCTSLEKIELPPSLLRLGDGVFEGCSSLTSIEMPATLKKMGNEVFKDCTNLEAITFEAPPEKITDKNTKKDTEKDDEADVEEFEEPNRGNLISIGDSVFENCLKLESIELPASLTKMGNSVFKNCTALESISLKKLTNLTRLGSSTFENCSHLESVELPIVLGEIGDNTFKGCSLLTEISMADMVSLIEIGSNAFENCVQLEQVELAPKLKELGDGAFKGCIALKEIELPVSLIWIGREVFDQHDLTIKTYYTQEEKPIGWANDWCVNMPTIEWGSLKSDLSVTPELAPSNSVAAQKGENQAAAA